MNYYDPDFQYDELDLQYDELENCFEQKMLRGEDIVDCLGYGGEEIGFWPNGGGDRCFRRLVIEADVLVGRDMVNHPPGEPTFGPCDKELRAFLNYHLGKCPDVERITIIGSELAMMKLKVLEGAKLKKTKLYKEYFRGINTQRIGFNSPRLVVSCICIRGRDSSSHVKKEYYT